MGLLFGLGLCPNEIGCPQLPLFSHWGVTTIEQRQKENQFLLAWSNMLFVLNHFVYLLFKVMLILYTPDGETGSEEELILCTFDDKTGSEEM